VQSPVSSGRQNEPQFDVGCGYTDEFGQEVTLAPFSAPTKPDGTLGAKDRFLDMKIAVWKAGSLLALDPPRCLRRPERKHRSAVQVRPAADRQARGVLDV